MLTGIAGLLLIIHQIYPLWKYEPKNGDTVQIISACSCSCKDRYYLDFDSEISKVLFNDYLNSSHSYWDMSIRLGGSIKFVSRSKQQALDIKKGADGSPTFVLVPKSQGVEWMIDYVSNDKFRLRVASGLYAGQYLSITDGPGLISGCREAELSDIADIEKATTNWRFIIGTFGYGEPRFNE